LIIKDRVNTSIISRKYGWYLARVNASFENFANIVATSLKNIQKYDLQPGRNIKISNFINAHPRIEFPDKFILLPYFKQFIKNYWLLNNIIQSLSNTTYQCVDKDYIKSVIKLLSTFYENQGNNRDFVLKELYEFDDKDNTHIDIAMPESWLNENSVDLGETVLLRNDEPSPVIM
jgi:hypothetical protein